jgi:CheY-like chemotaxis protein
MAGSPGGGEGHGRREGPGVGADVPRARARSPWSHAGPEPSLDEALDDPTVGLLLRRDGLTAEGVRAEVRAAAHRRRAAADGGDGGDGAGLRGLRVLLVEDEALIALDLEATLRGFGCEVAFAAPSVGDALAALRAGRPDAALLDLRLRDGRATPVAAALAAAGVPFAVVSGYDACRAEEEPVLRGAPFLGKPCGRADLRATLARLAASVSSRRRQPEPVLP